jgi:DNA-binding MarR family transcriptional regulator
VVFATARGKRVVARLIDAARAHEAELLAGLGRNEVTQLKGLLRRLAHRDKA